MVRIHAGEPHLLESIVCGGDLTPCTSTRTMEGCLRQLKASFCTSDTLQNCRSPQEPCCPAQQAPFLDGLRVSNLDSWSHADGRYCSSPKHTVRGLEACGSVARVADGASPHGFRDGAAALRVHRKISSARASRTSMRGLSISTGSRSKDFSGFLGRRTLFTSAK